MRLIQVPTELGENYIKLSNIFITVILLFQVTKMLMTIVLLFMLCWLPIQLFILVVDLAPSLVEQIYTLTDEYIYLAVFIMCHWLAMANSFMNPIIYCFLNENFRVTVKHLSVRRSTRLPSSTSAL